MERLSIDEIIAHCNRHTDEVEKRQRKTLLEMGDMDYPAMKQYWEHRQVAEYLNELQQYRAIGTVDQCREAVERMKPKKPHKYVAFDGIERNGCPRCYEERGRNEILYAGQKYCSVCAQAIDRSE